MNLTCTFCNTSTSTSPDLAKDAVHPLEFLKAAEQEGWYCPTMPPRPPVCPACRKKQGGQNA